MSPMTLLVVMAVVATSITLAQLASLGVQVFVPLLVGLVTKKSTDPTLKAVLLLFLSSVNGFLTEFISSDNFRLDQAILSALVLWIVGIATHLGFLRPTGLADKAQSALVKD